MKKLTIKTGLTALALMISINQSAKGADLITLVPNLVSGNDTFTSIKETSRGISRTDSILEIIFVAPIAFALSLLNEDPDSTTLIQALSEAGYSDQDIAAIQVDADKLIKLYSTKYSSREEAIHAIQNAGLSSATLSLMGQ